MSDTTNVVIQLTGGIMGAALFGLFYLKATKKKPSRYILTAVASVISLFFAIASEYPPILTVITLLVGLPIFYGSLTEENEFLNKAYKNIKFSGAFKFIIIALLVLTIIYFINYASSSK